MKRINNAKLIDACIRSSPATVPEIAHETGLSEIQVRQILSVLTSVGYMVSVRDKGSGLFRYSVSAANR